MSICNNSIKTLMTTYYWYALCHWTRLNLILDTCQAPISPWILSRSAAAHQTVFVEHATILYITCYRNTAVCTQYTGNEKHHRHARPVRGLTEKRCSIYRLILPPAPVARRHARFSRTNHCWRFSTRFYYLCVCTSSSFRVTNGVWHVKKPNGFPST